MIIFYQNHLSSMMICSANCLFFIDEMFFNKATPKGGIN